MITRETTNCGGEVPHSYCLLSRLLSVGTAYTKPERQVGSLQTKQAVSVSNTLLTNIYSTQECRASLASIYCSSYSIFIVIQWPGLNINQPRTDSLSVCIWSLGQGIYFTGHKIKTMAVHCPLSLVEKTTIYPYCTHMVAYHK